MSIYLLLLNSTDKNGFLCLQPVEPVPLYIDGGDFQE